MNYTLDQITSDAPADRKGTSTVKVAVSYFK